MRNFMENKREILDRFRGAMLGLAVGDAMGVPLEFTIPGSFQPVNDMIGGGPFQLEPGMWTDDTSLALCLAQSLIEKVDFDPTDQLSRYLRWYQEGYMSVNGSCFDIGNNNLEKPWISLKKQVNLTLVQIANILQVTVL